MRRFDVRLIEFETNDDAESEVCNFRDTTATRAQYCGAFVVWEVREIGRTATEKVCTAHLGIHLWQMADA